MNNITALARKYTYFLIPLVLFVIAFGVRLEHLHSYRHNPEYLQPDMDEKYHVTWAREVSQGNLLPRTAFFRAPLYPYFLALLMKLSGSDLHLVRILQAIIGALTVVLLYFLALRFFDWRYASAAGLIGAMTFYLVYFSTELLIPVILVPLNILFLLAFLKAYQDDCVRWYLLAGGLAGLSALTRPNILLAIAVLVIFLIVKKRVLLKPVLFSAMTLLIILPVTVINYWVSSGDFVLIASQGGVNFYIGNNAASDGMRAVVPGQREDWWGGYIDSIEFAEKSEGRKLKPSEVSSFYYRRAFSWMGEAPFTAMWHFLKKTYFFFHGHDIPNNKDIYFIKYFFGSGYVPYIQYSFLSALALLGLFLAFRQKENKDEWLIVNLFGLSYILSFILFFICARFRLPVIPVMVLQVVLAALTIIRSKGKTRSVLLISLVLLLLLTNIPVFNKIHNFGTYAILYGVKYRDQGDYQKAIAFIESARDYKHPEHIIENELGIVAYVQKDLDNAREHFDRSLSYRSDFSQAKHNLALIDFDTGQYQKAFDRLRTIKTDEILNNQSMFSLFVDLQLLLGKQEELLTYLSQLVLEDSHYRGLARKADELLKGKFYANAQLIYSFLYSNKFKNPELMNNLGIAEYNLGNKDRARFLFAMSGSKEAQENLRLFNEAEGISEEDQSSAPL